MKPNWFIAFPLSVDVELPPPPARVRLFAPEDRHVTAAFLGGVDPSVAAEAWALALDVELGAVDVHLQDTRLLGGRRPTAIAALLSKGREDVARIMVRVQAPLIEAALLGRDPRPPLPHATLARIHPKASDAERALAESWRQALPLDVGARLGELALYTWSDERRTRLFRIVGRRPLNA